MNNKTTERPLLVATHDCIFKALMLDVKTKDYLKELICEITKIPIEFLKNMIIENSEHLVDNVKDKKMRSDIIVSIGNKYINIEMNNEYYKGIMSKNYAYMYKIGTSIQKEGEYYVSGKNLIQINFNNFNRFENIKDIYHLVLMDKESHEEDPDSMQIYHVNLLNIKERCYTKDVKTLSKFERLCLLLLAETREFAEYIAGDDKVMNEASKRLEEISQDKELIGLYDAEEQERKIRATIKKGAFEDGIEQGIEQGMKKGAEETKIAMIKTMYKNGMPIEDIAKYNEISLEEVNEIIEDK